MAELCTCRAPRGAPASPCQLCGHPIATGERHENALRLAALRAEIASGIRDLDKSDFVEVEAVALERYLARLTPRRRARKRMH